MMINKSPFSFLNILQFTLLFNKILQYIINMVKSSCCFSLGSFDNNIIMHIEISGNLVSEILCR